MILCCLSMVLYTQSLIGITFTSQPPIKLRHVCGQQIMEKTKFVSQMHHMFDYVYIYIVKLG